MLRAKRPRALLKVRHNTSVLVLGEVMWDRLIWSGVASISPKASMPVVELQRESFMPDDAANVTRNLTGLDPRYGLSEREHRASSQASNPSLLWRR